MTTQQFIDKTLALIGRLRIGQGAGPSESAAVLEMLNQLLASWSVEHLSIYHVANSQHLLTSGKGFYSFGETGSGADFETGRPVKIQSAGIIRSGLRFDLKLINSLEWHNIREKRVAASGAAGVQALLPLSLYNDNAWPDTTLHLWPTPWNGALTNNDDLQDTIWRTLLLKDTTVGDDIADHLTVQESGQGTFITAVLRKAIEEDLTVEVVKEGIVIGTITVPSATAVDQPINLDISTVAFVEDEVISWNVTASDGQTDQAGVASVTVEWKKESAAPDLTAIYLDLTQWLILTSIAGLGTDLDLPPGYQRALMYNLALDVASQFPNVQLPQNVVAIAAQSKMDIQKLNATNNVPVEDIAAGPEAA